MTTVKAVLDVLRRAGFTTVLAYRAFLTLDSYSYGFIVSDNSADFEFGLELISSGFEKLLEAEGMTPS